MLCNHKVLRSIVSRRSSIALAASIAMTSLCGVPAVSGLPAASPDLWQTRLQPKPYLAEDVSGGETETPTPTPPPPENSCELYRVDFTTKHVGDHGHGFTRVKDHSEQPLQCFGDLLDQAFAENEVAFDRHAYEENGGASYSFGEKGASFIMQTFYDKLLAAQQPPLSRDTYQSNKQYAYCPEGFNRPVNHNASRGFFGGWPSRHSNQYGCMNGSFALDDSCQLQKIASAKLDNLCGTLEYHSTMHTPISLLWDGIKHEELDATLTSFPLDPKNPSKSYLWKGSARAPLLVYDPQHNGRITSSFQLFGSWTFGGQSVASVVGGKPTPWNDGYQALATLDSNGDGKVSGAELAPLGLWFDADRDGVAKAGEVKAIAETGVTALFYTPDVNDTERHHLVATRGYERMLDGKTLQGGSVDWTVPGSKDASDLVVSQLLAARAKSIAVASEPPVFAANPVPQAEAQPGQAYRDVSGVWTWQLNLPTVTQGHFLLHSDGAVVYGDSILEMGVKGLRGASRLINFAALDGIQSIRSDGKTKIDFSVMLADGAKLTSSAVMISESEMSGATTLEPGTSSAEKVSYTWTATRKVSPK